MRIRTLSLWRQIIFLPRHGARYMYWQQSGPFCLRKPGLEMYLSLWIIWFLYWWDFSQHGLKNGILHGWQEARENSIFSCLLWFLTTSFNISSVRPSFDNSKICISMFKSTTLSTIPAVLPYWSFHFPNVIAPKLQFCVCLRIIKKRSGSKKRRKNY